MSKSSGISNKPPVKLDVSPKKGKSKYSYREAGVAIAIIIILLAVYALAAAGFNSKGERDLQNALVETAELKAEYETKIDELAEAAKKLAKREGEVTTREDRVLTREIAVKKAEENLESERQLLESDRANLTIEEEEFAKKQNRVKELCEALSIELTPEEDE